MHDKLLLLKRECGSIVQIPCYWEILSPKDEKETCEFYAKIANTVGNPEVFCPDHTIAEDLAGQGHVLGIRAEGKIICLRVLTRNPSVLAEYAHVFGDDVVKGAICSDACIVDSAFRGNNLQQLTWFRMEATFIDGYSCAVLTVSPQNPVSLSNVMSCGFMIFGYAKMYGGHDRFILKKDFSNPVRIETRDHVEVSIHDSDRITELLRIGYAAYKMHHRGAGSHLLFGKLDINH